MARQVARKIVESLCGLALGAGVAAGCAQEAAAPLAPPPLSPACEAPAGDIAAPAQLPHVAAALRRGRLRIVAIGSSSTSGVGASSAAEAYPAQLETILEGALASVDVVIANRGVSGEVASVAAERIKSEVALEKPDLLLWQLGTNDALARVAPEEFEDTVRSTIRWLKDNEVDTVLVGLQYSSRFSRDSEYFAIRDALQRVAAAETVAYVRRYDAMRFIAQNRANLQLMARDNFHLNDLGYRCMAEHVARAVIVGLFAKRRPPGN
ncbi:SGNH/GDSL hydrolase family protein [Methylosinus sp. Sm6]|uniref:SGNH/GDSL hydrolase family protein n=1 Tax=Methylosinus sp. Sm6 TaxID=2866948 RepID=UPI001C98ED2F|nr:SGNH/GDSL hydrolase family protein [Methylosinus sp. Sm6]MBY6242721.1 SGNH/GDSL hydrolase family protein [Methylosinus sp. Sm6]